MPGWSGSDRRSRLPANWSALRSKRLQLDGSRCRWLTNGERCNQPASEVDHIKPGDNHSLANLRSLCTWHHAKKSGGEGAAARAAAIKRAKGLYRRKETHPSSYV